METGRWVVQVSPTGFSAFVSPTGEVFERTAISEQAVRTMDIELRRGPNALHTASAIWPLSRWPRSC